MTIGILIFLVFLYAALVLASHRLHGAQIELTQVRIAIGGVMATLALAFGVLYQGVQNRELNEDSNRRGLVQQEADWIPEVRQPLHQDLLAFSGNRAWYPWFKANIEGVECRWSEEWVRRITDASKVEDEEIDWSFTVDHAAGWVRSPG